jgi:hypothetical protein
MPDGCRIGSRGTLFISENVRTNRQSTCTAALPARMRRDQRPLLNRVTPFGDVVAISQRGLYIGNRGIIHDPGTKTLLGRRWTTKAWLVCVLDYKGRRRELMGGRSWTELFFLDEAVALAAGHRPCFFCRRGDAQAFRAAWGKAKGGGRLWRRRLMRYYTKSGWTEAANGSMPSLVLLQNCPTAP